MKTFKFLGSTVLLCLFVVACAKSNKEDQARQGGKTPDTFEADKPLDSRAGDRPEITFDVEKEGYTSQNVVLTKNAEGESKNAGQIKIFEDDARRLYERMKVVATATDAATDYASNTKTKQGKNLACSQFTRGGDVLVYSCIIAIDYRTGKLAFGDQTITVDENAKVNTEAYATDGLSILQGEEGNGILSVKGNDAKALYDTLKVDEKSLVDTADSWLSSKEKLGANLRCYKHTTLKTDAAPSYTCSFSVNVNDGTVKASDVVAPKAAAAPAAPESAKPEDTKENEKKDEAAKDGSALL